MSLHGTVMVNGELVGAWSATRTSLEIRETNLYACEVLSHYVDGRPMVRETFDLPHRYDAGALALASRVLTHGADVSSAS